jgi:secreted PhoX family phosphatase
MEDQGRADAMRFSWDIFLFGAEEDAGSANLSGLTASNSFSSPDGIWFSQATGICWIQTDDGAMTDESNCMMVAALPGRLGDGRFVTVQNELDGQTAEQVTRMGAPLNEQRLKRFLVGPKGSEITGLCETPDGKALFVNIQHPGENTSAADLLQERYESHWPGNQGHGKAGRPRSATIAITRDDGGLIGL